MTLRTRWELVAALSVLAVFITFLTPAIFHARIAVRDDIRVQDITHLKRALEAYNNIAKYYVKSPTQQATCTSSNDSESWFFGSTSPLLKTKVIDALPHDLHESSGYVYSYCVTKVEVGQAIGYYLQARFEEQKVPQKDFDEDESRKFYYRILEENGQTLYRVCGGTEEQCVPN